MPCISKSLVVVLCKAIAAVFRKTKRYSNSYKVKEHHDCEDRAEGGENRPGPKISNDDGSGILPPVKSSQHSPSRLKEEKFFRIYNAKLAPMGTSKYNSLIVLSEFWTDVLNTNVPPAAVSKSTSLPSGINVCGRYPPVTETNHNAMYHHRGHATGYLSQDNHMTRPRSIIQLNIDHHLRNQLVTANGLSGTLL